MRRDLGKRSWAGLVGPVGGMHFGRSLNGDAEACMTMATMNTRYERHLILTRVGRTCLVGLTEMYSR